MKIDVQFKIKNDPMLQRYIRENSYWYKNLNRNPNLLNSLSDEMKERYKLTTADKINNFGQKLDLIKTFINVLK